MDVAAAPPPPPAGGAGGKRRARRAPGAADPPCLTGALLRGRWRVGKPLGRGGFGVTYRGLDVETRAPVAIKVEHPHTTAKHRHRSPLKNEMALYAALHPCPGLPRVEWSGALRVRGGAPARALVMELLGPSLERARAARPGGALPLDQVMSAGRQLLRLLRHAHRRGVVHRDVKPDNAMLGRGACSERVFLVDLGLAKQVRAPPPPGAAGAGGGGGAHVPRAEGRRLTGSARYCSLATHRGYSQTYADDLEMLAYTLIYLHQGSLPWQSLPAPSGEEPEEGTREDRDRRKKEARYRAIGAAKQAYAPPDNALGWLLRCARRLEYAQFPPYNEIMAQFDAAPEDTLSATSTDTDSWTLPLPKNPENG